MIWAAAKVVLFAAWSLVLSYFVVSLALEMSPGLWVAPDGFAVALFAVALLIFPTLWVAFRKIAPREYNLSELPAGSEAHDQR